MNLNRRHFLGGLAASTLLAPFTRVLANGLPSNAPRRLAIFFSPNGTVHRHWRPTGSTYNFGFNPGSILEPLDAIRDRVIVLDGINFVNATNHEGGMSAMLTGGGSGGVSAMLTTVVTDTSGSSAGVATGWGGPEATSSAITIPPS